MHARTLARWRVAPSPVTTNPNTLAVIPHSCQRAYQTSSCPPHIHTSWRCTHQTHLPFAPLTHTVMYRRQHTHTAGERLERTLETETITVPINTATTDSADSTLNITRIFDPSIDHNTTEPVLLLHGAIENGRIFHANGVKGFAPYLARHGYDTYVMDLRGHGLSHPPLSKASEYGQTEHLLEDIPACIDVLIERKQLPQHWVAHSWGGVLMNAFLARRPEYRDKVKSRIYFGTKRTVEVWNIQRLVYIELVWKRLCKVMTTTFPGYVPGKTKYFAGMDNDTRRQLYQSCEWVEAGSPWVDHEDGFNYNDAIIAAQAAKEIAPALYVAGKQDLYLGNPADVRRFMIESGDEINEDTYLYLSKEHGNHHDYDHNTMLTHKSAVHDHFPTILQWMHKLSAGGRNV
eukprot:GFYU01010911.1.p1 GENE.GFYU01010911.1~~GFYU01010911.1.p1  ORF type:complete len:419 (+),score=64.89 GFYU01010911.1:50-1258(+)